MRILIVHDRAEVAEKIENVVREAAGRNTRVDTAVDVFSARDQLRTNFYDLAIIDLTLPVRKDRGEANLENANLLLAEIFESGDVRTPADVIGISLDPSVLSSVSTQVGEHLMGCIHEDAAGIWRTQLTAKIHYVMNARRARQLVSNSSHDVDAVIITALDKEARPYARLFELSASSEMRNAQEFSFTSADGLLRRGILFAVGASGQAPSAAATQALLCQFRPKLMLMTGFCGGVHPRVNFGDAVAFKSAAAWDYGKWEEIKNGEETRSAFRPRPGALNLPQRGVADVIRAMSSNYEADKETVERVTAASRGALVGWRLRAAAAGSGSAVVTSIEKLEEITGLDENIWAIDMESYAFYHACLNTPVLPPDFLCLKAVADYCNGEKDSKLHDACSMISASIAREIITKRYSFGG